MAYSAICCLGFNYLFGQSTWTAARQQSYLDDCAHTLAREFGTDQPRDVCQCMLEKTVHRHPNPDQLDREMEDPAGEAGKINAFAQEIIFPCLNTVHPFNWLKPMETQFRASCRENARKYLAEAEVVPYCNCMEEQVKKAYPGAGDFASLSIANMDIELAQMGESCLEQVLQPPVQR
jgi:hypothetical protein